MAVSCGVYFDPRDGAGECLSRLLGSSLTPPTQRIPSRWAIDRLSLSMPIGWRRGFCSSAPASSELLRLAARCQHLERWTVPRNSYPEGRAGYLTWRKLPLRKAGGARPRLARPGRREFEEADDAASWVAKSGLQTNPNTQLLEDAACLVFLENEISTFAAEHAEYPREKFITIVAKTWRKMSQAARDAAARIDLPPALAEIFEKQSRPRKA